MSRYQKENMKELMKDELVGKSWQNLLEQKQKPIVSLLTDDAVKIKELKAKKVCHRKKN